MMTHGNALLGSAHNRRLLLRRKSEVLFIFLFLLALMGIAAALDDKFLSIRNLRNLMSSNVPLFLAAFGQTFIILLGGVDLSVGAVISLSNVICATMMRDDPVTWILPLLLCAGSGLLVGLINGLLVTKGRLQPIITTLATQTIVAGIALLTLGGPGGYAPSSFCKFLNRGWNHMVPLLIVALSFAILWPVLNRTRFGRAVFAVGGNEQSARSAGITVDSVKIRAFMMSGLMAALAGIYITAYITSGSPIVGEQYSQRSINAVVVGGASLMGGRGGLTGCIAAVLILGIINNLLNLTGVSSYYQYVLQGGILILALAISALKSRR